jgi:hypothetical protein
MDFLLFTTAVLALLAVAIYYLYRISEDLRLVRSLLAAFMEQRVASTVADNKLAAAVEAARGETQRRGVA